MGGVAPPAKQPPAVMSNAGFPGYRTISQHLNDLKKENFSLKLRIYFLEERIQQKYEESSGDVFKRDIELKVEVQSLKKELEEKQQLLNKALSTVESLSNQNEAELQQRLAERQEDISNMQEILRTKVQFLQEEAELARAEAERMSSLVDAESQRCLALEREVAVRAEECRGLRLRQGDRLIEELTQENSSLSLQVRELKVKVHDLTSSPQKQEEAELLRNGVSQDDHIKAEMMRLIDEQQGQLSGYESAAGQCVGELQKAQGQVCSLQAKIRESEARSQKLQLRLGEMELELHSAREAALRQERDLQNLSDTAASKETEAAELYRVIEEQNNTLCSLKELAGQNQLQQCGAEGPQGPGEVLALQASLFQAQLELQAADRSQRQAGRAQENLRRALERLEADLEGALQHRRDTQRHNQELHVAMETARQALQESEERLREKEAQRQQEEAERERTIRELRSSLQTKEQQLQDYTELLEQQQDPTGNRDSLLHTLRQRIKGRDRALERAVDEKFRLVEEAEQEVGRLQMAGREKERDLERQRCVLANNEETIASLEVLLRGKALEAQQVGEAGRSARQQQRESAERQALALRERDAIISQMQSALHARSLEAEDLRRSLIGQLQLGPSQVLEELKARLRLKDRLFQEVLADRSRQAQEHQAHVQDLLNTLGDRDQYIQDAARRQGELVGEQTSRLQELRRQLSSRGQRSDSLSDGELAEVREELTLAVRRVMEAQQESDNQAARMGALTRALHTKEELIKGFQRQLAEQSDLPLVEMLTQEVQELRERLAQQDLAPARGPLGLGRPHNDRQPEFGGGHQRSMGQYL